jgi:hypothetical protein
VHGDALTTFLVNPCSYTITYLNPDIAGKRVGEYYTSLISWHRPGADESLLTIVTSTANTTILSTMNAAVASQPDPSKKITELWGWWKERNGDGGLNVCNVTFILDYNTAAGWAKLAMKVNNPTHFLHSLWWST